MIDPRGLGLHEWADALLLVVNDVSTIGRLLGDDWQPWAVGIVRSQPFVQRVLPDPYQFTDWRDWAMRVYPMLEGQG